MLEATREHPAMLSLLIFWPQVLGFFTAFSVPESKRIGKNTWETLKKGNLTTFVLHHLHGMFNSGPHSSN